MCGLVLHDNVVVFGRIEPASANVIHIAKVAAVHTRQHLQNKIHTLGRHLHARPTVIKRHIQLRLKRHAPSHC